MLGSLVIITIKALLCEGTSETNRSKYIFMNIQSFLILTYPLEWKMTIIFMLYGVWGYLLVCKLQFEERWEWMMIN
jgi:hypothetical protein